MPESREGMGKGLGMLGKVSCCCFFLSLRACTHGRGQGWWVVVDHLDLRVSKMMNDHAKYDDAESERQR